MQPPRVIDTKCLDGDCVFLTRSDAQIPFERTGALTGKVRLGGYDAKAKRLIPAAEAPLNHLKIPTGWTVIASSYLPEEFDIEAPGLRIRAIDARGNSTVLDEGHVLLHTLRGADALGFAQGMVILSSIGSHAYDVRTKVWILPAKGDPHLLLDVMGLLQSVQTATPKGPPGLWIEFETYNGVHGTTKGRRLSFVRWDATLRRFIQ